MSDIETNLRIVRLQVALEASDAALTAVRGQFKRATDALEGLKTLAIACEFRGPDYLPPKRVLEVVSQAIFDMRALSSPPEAPKDLGQAGLRRDSGTDPVASVLALDCIDHGAPPGSPCRYIGVGIATPALMMFCASRIRLASTEGKP